MPSGRFTAWIHIAKKKTDLKSLSVYHRNWKKSKHKSILSIRKKTTKMRAQTKTLKVGN